MPKKVYDGFYTYHCSTHGSVPYPTSASSLFKVKIYELTIYFQ